MVCIGVPILTIGVKLISGPGETWPHLVKNLLATYTINSLWLVLGCGLVSLVLGISSAWVVARYRIPFQKPIEWMLILPLTIPSYITAYTYAGIFDYGGTLELLLRTVGITTVKIDVMNIYGLIVVLGLSLFPYVYVSAKAVFLHQSGRLLEASKILGENERNTFFKIVLPVARPAIVGGLILVVMEVLNDYGAAKYYGINTFTTGIFRSWFAFEEPATAVYLSALLLVVVFLFILFERLQRGDKLFVSSSKSNIKLQKKNVSKIKQLVLFLVVSVPIVFGFLIPFIQLLYWATLTYKDVINPLFFNIAMQSLWLSLLASFLTVVFSLMLLYFPKWNRLKKIQNISKITLLGYAIPGAVIAVGVMIPTLFFDKWLIKTLKQLWGIEIGLLINGSILVLLYAFVIRFLTVAYNPIEANQFKIGNALPESSKLLGKNNLRTFFKIELPLLKIGILSAFILVFVDIMKELPLTLILKPYHINTLAVKAYEYASDELIMETAIPSLSIIATGIIPIILLNRLLLNHKQDRR